MDELACSELINVLRVFQELGPRATEAEDCFLEVRDLSDLGIRAVCKGCDRDSASLWRGLTVSPESSLSVDCRFCTVDMNPQPPPNIDIGSGIAP